MDKRRRTKLHQTLGIARLVVILSVLALVLVAAALYPVIQHYRFRADALGCLAGLDTARRQLAAEYLFEGENSSAEQARDFVGFVMAGWDDLCPGGGTTYIVPKDDSELAWDVVCGLHGQDRRQCTRLNADYVLQQLRGQFDVEPRYYSDKNSEIDFVLQYGTEIIPVEAKGGEDKSAPSFKKYIKDNQPEHALRYSKRGYRKDGDITNLPLYLARKTRELL